MASGGDVLNEKILPAVLKFINTRPVQAIKNGMMYIMPLTIVGAIFLLLGNLPFPGWVDWLVATGYYPIVMSVYVATFNLLGIVACIGITYSFVAAEGIPALPPAIYATSLYVMMIPQSVTIPDTETVVDAVLPLEWTGSQGMIGGILIGFYVGYIYSWFIKKDITIKMPDGVPPNVANAFTSLIPGTVLLLSGAVVYGIMEKGFDTTLIQAIYSLIQTPLSNLTDSIGGVIVLSAVGPLLWFFGIHGASIIGGIMSPILLANTASNQAIIDSGMELTRANGGAIVTQQFWDGFVAMTGSGITIGLVVYMLVWAKSAQFKTLGRLGAFPGIFNINEPIIFGTPIVMNPILFIPFVFTPVLTLIIQYLAILWGFVPLYGGIIAPWTTPPIISGLITNGWQAALLQALIIVLSVFMYLPFARKLDRDMYNQELAAHEEHVLEEEALEDVLD